MRKIEVTYQSAHNYKAEVREFLIEAGWWAVCVGAAIIFALGLFSLAMYILGHAVLLGGL